MSISPPTVIYRRDEKGGRLEPIEELVVDCDTGAERRKSGNEGTVLIKNDELIIKNAIKLFCLSQSTARSTLSPSR